MFSTGSSHRTNRRFQVPRRDCAKRSRLWLEPLEDRTVPSTINWKSGASGSWNDASKWDLNRVPTVSDDAVISFSGIIVTHSASASNSVNSLSSQADLVISGGSLSFAAASSVSATLTLSAGTLTGAGNLTVSRLVTWSGGTLSGTGHLTANGGISIDGTASLTLDRRTIDNENTATRTPGAGVITTSNGGMWNNDSVLNLQDDNFLHWSGTGAAPQVTNTGMLEKTGGTGVTSFPGSVTNSGTIDVASGTITLAGGGVWTGGGYYGYGNGLTNAGSLTITSSGNHIIQGTINNTGTITQTGGSTVYFEGATINNEAGGVYDVQNGNFQWNGGTSAINNAGTFEKDAASGAGTFSVQMPFNNSAGTIIVQAGTLDLDGGGTATSGTFTVASGAVVDFTGAQTFSGTFSGSGSGTVQASGATIAVAAGTSAAFNLPGAGFVIAGGTLTGDGTVSGTFTWTSGTVGASDSGSLTTTGTWTLSGSAAHYLRNLTNAGSMTQTADLVYVYYGTLTNQAGGTYDLQGGALSYFSGTESVTNSGTFKKSTGSGTATVGVAFNEAGGTVLVQAGTLALVGGNSGTAASYNVQAGCTLQLGGDGTTTGASYAVASGALVDYTGGGTQTFSGTFTASGSGTVQASGATITVAAGTSAAFNLPGAGFVIAGGTLTGDGTVTGTFTWTSGHVGPASDSTGLTSTGTWTVSGSTAHYLGQLNNAGTMTQTADLVYVFYGTLTNQAGGTYDLQGGALSYFSGTESVTNSGTFKKSIGSGTATVGVAFNEAGGTVLVQAGTLALVGGNSGTAASYNVQAGCTLQLGGDGTTTGASYAVASGALVDYTAGGTQTFSGTFTASGAGTVQASGATITVAAGTSAAFNLPGAGFVIAGGTLTGDGTVSGAFTWTSGTVGASDSGSLTTTGAWNISGSAAHLLRNLTNAGTMTQTADLVYVYYGTLTNQAGGTYDLQGGALSYFSGTESVTNSGTFKKSAGSGTATVGVAFTNSGTIAAQAGTLSLSVFNNLSSGTLSGGTYLVTATLQLSGGNITTNAAALTLNGTGSKILNSSGTSAIAGLTSNAAGGSFTVLGGRTFSTANFTNTGTVLVGANSGLTTSSSFYRQNAGSTTVLGTLTATHLVDIEGGTLGGSGTITGNVTNAATVGPGSSPGILTVSGSYTQTAAGTLAIEVGGTTAGSGYDRLAISGAATLNGTLSLAAINGFVPAVTDTYQVLTFASASGSFATVTGRVLPNGKSFKVNYDAGDVTLSVRQLAVSAANPSLNDEGTYNGPAASFTDTDASLGAGNFSATIDWGDGHTQTGTITPSGGFSVTGTNTYADEGTYPTTVTVTDLDSGSVVTVHGTTTVADAALSATGHNLSTTENSPTGTVTVATFTDLGGPEALADYGASIAWGDGGTDTGTLVANSDGSFSVQGSHTYADSGSYTVAVHITHENGVTADTTSTATIVNVPPTAGLSGPGDAVPEQMLTYSLTATDPSPVDQAAGFTFNVTWGDGASNSVSGPSPQSLSHAYTAPGSYTISVTATDKDGGTSTAVTQTVTVVNAELQGGDLAVGGTTGNDSFTYGPGSNPGDVVVTRNGTALGTFHPTGSINTYGGSGTDSVVVNGTAGADSFGILAGGLTLGGVSYNGDSVEKWQANGQGGNDTFTVASGGVATIDGGTGTDTLVGSDSTNAWVLTDAGAGTLNGTSFLNLENLTGGAGTDTFKLKPGGSVAGTLNGGAGTTDRLDFSLASAAVTVNLQTKTAPGMGHFANIEALTGSAFADTLQGANVPSTWQIQFNNTGKVGSYSFGSFENLTGGTANNTFKLSNGKGVSGTIDGGAGVNTLDYTAYTTAVAVVLADSGFGTATNITGGVTNIQNVTGGSGNDTLTGNSADNVLVGNAGNDVLNGGAAGNDILVGGAGNDSLTGGSGRSLLLGGGGADTITSGGDDDILIAGTTSYDTNSTALLAILSEWKRTDEDYTTRIGHLRNGGGNNGSTKLNSSTAHNDTSVDVLTGGPGMDWFWASLAEITDRDPSEQVN